METQTRVTRHFLIRAMIMRQLRQPYWMFKSDMWVLILRTMLEPKCWLACWSCDGFGKQSPVCSSNSVAGAPLSNKLDCVHFVQVLKSGNYNVKKEIREKLLLFFFYPDPVKGHNEHIREEEWKRLMCHSNTLKTYFWDWFEIFSLLLIVTCTNSIYICLAILLPTSWR